MKEYIEERAIELAKFIKYIKNVYGIQHKINKLSDVRVNPSFKTGQVCLPVLFGLRRTAFKIYKVCKEKGPKRQNSNTDCDHLLRFAIKDIA